MPCGTRMSPAETDLGPNEGLIEVPGSRRALLTPALVVDLDKFETNLLRHQRICGEAGLRMRPHAKTHKCSEIAKRQAEAGAVGVCCATLHEAEVMVGAGIDGVLITSPVVGAARIGRMIKLAGAARRFKLVADNPGNLRAISEAAEALAQPLEVLVDIDIGMQRTGVAAPEDAVALARMISEAPNLTYRGVQAYSGRVQHINDLTERRQVYGEQLAHLKTVIEALGAAGLPPAIVTGGGTASLVIDIETGIFTEHQTGSYIFMDVEYNEVSMPIAGNIPFQTSLLMQCTVVSNNADGFVTINGGYKSFATDGPKPKVADPELSGSIYDRFGDEHGKIVLGPGNLEPELGAPVNLITPHCDPTVNLHNYLHCVRGDKLVDIWPIDARGVL